MTRLCQVYSLRKINKVKATSSSQASILNYHIAKLLVGYGRLSFFLKTCSLWKVEKLSHLLSYGRIVNNSTKLKDVSEQKLRIILLN